MPELKRSTDAWLHTVSVTSFLYYSSTVVEYSCRTYIYRSMYFACRDPYRYTFPFKFILSYMYGTST